MTSRILATLLFLAVTPIHAWSTEAVSVVTDGHVSNPRQPQVAIDNAGKIYVAFGAEGSVYCAKSGDRAQTFDAPTKIGTVPALALGKRRGPRVVAGKEAVVITAISHEDGDVLAWRSEDGAQTWQGPVVVNDSRAVAKEGLHAMAVGPGGEMYCVWLDNRNLEKGQQIYEAVSVDGGKTWSENRLVYRSPSGSICPCCHPAVTVDSQGTVFVMFRNSLDGNRDMHVAISKDKGKSFGDVKKLGSGSWELNSCPMDGGYLASTSAGKITTLWRREKQVFRADLNAGTEQLLGTGEQPWITGTPEGAYLVWLSNRRGSLWLSVPNSRQPVKLSENANDPVIASSFTGKSPIVAVWESGETNATRIMAAVVGN